MPKQQSFWDFEERLDAILVKGDPLEKLAATVDFERFRSILEKAAGHPRGAGRGFEIQDACAAEPSRSVAGRNGDDGARPDDLAALFAALS